MVSCLLSWVWSVQMRLLYKYESLISWGYPMHRTSSGRFRFRVNDTAAAEEEHPTAMLKWLTTSLTLSHTHSFDGILLLLYYTVFLMPMHINNAKFFDSEDFNDYCNCRGAWAVAWDADVAYRTLRSARWCKNGKREIVILWSFCKLIGPLYPNNVTRNTGEISRTSSHDDMDDMNLGIIASSRVTSL